MGINNQIIELIKQRLDKGWEEYGREVPIRRERNLSNIDEAVDEILDLTVYLTAYILELKADKEEAKANVDYNGKMTVQPFDLSTIFKGLHMLHSAAWEENQQSEANQILDLITKMKRNCNWDYEDDKRIGQSENPINIAMNAEDINGPTKCIPGSNCD